MSKTQSSFPSYDPQSVGQPRTRVDQTPEPQRIFLVCGKTTLDAIRQSLCGEGDLVACGEGTPAIQSIPRMADVRPDLVIIELEGFSLDELEIVGAPEAVHSRSPTFCRCGTLQPAVRKTGHFMRN